MNALNDGAGDAGRERDGLESQRSRGRPRIREAAGDLGGALALVSALMLVSQFWAHLGIGVQIAVLMLAGLVLGAVGQWVDNGELDSSASRFAGLLWLLSVPAMGAAVWAAVDARPDPSARLAWLAGGSAATVWALRLWRARRGALQQLAAFAALLVMAVGGLEALGAAVLPDWLGLLRLLGNEWAAMFVWIAGCVWAVLAWGGWVRPRRAGLILGGLAAPAGALWLSLTRPRPGLTLTALTVTALLASGLARMRAVRRRSPMAAEPSRRPIGLVIAAAFAAAASFGATLVLGALRPPPFPGLADAPDPGIAGTVAFWETRETLCLAVVDAGGGTVRRLRCDGAMSPDLFTASPGEALQWTPEGNLAFGRWANGGQERLTIDARTGAVLERRSVDGGTGWATPTDPARGPDGTVAEIDSSGDTAVLRLHPPEGSPRTLLEATGPRDYEFDNVIWSPDGAWLLVTDTVERLLLVDADTGATRLLAVSAVSPAWSAGPDVR